ncbi:hypothetical protein MmiHf6_15260 [Methanimicrococcus hongohii]|uniref:Uncharacterized protein n=1 Tax=Methanimicrococcus hongohii TaxID=3028295 RepID=A0AA96V9X6_9EURY|nr:hypothetical protein [Methanimicrococcus sp. Hf6]WNY24196.1 hypothetical protein MmiHf6_15260 [Methanimicrococcus sp. Hf6]
MKQFLFFWMVLILVFAAAFSGCLTDGENPGIEGEMISGNPFTSEVFTIDDDIYAAAAIILTDPSNQTVLEENITVEHNGNMIYIDIPIWQTRASAGEEEYEIYRANISIGKKSDYDNKGNFSVSVNGQDENETRRFSVENETLYVYGAASIKSGQFELDGDEIIFRAGTIYFNSAEHLDYDGMIQSDGFDSENNYFIYLPAKTADYGRSVNDREGHAEFVVGNQKELEDGKYTVSINDYELTFEIQNHEMINDEQFDSVWCF